MSGYLEYDRGKGDTWGGGFFLQKPFSRETLIGKIEEALSHEPVAPTA